MNKHKFNWFVELVYQINLYVGDEKDIKHMENYKNACLEYEKNLKGKKRINCQCFRKFSKERKGNVGK